MNVGQQENLASHVGMMDPDGDADLALAEDPGVKNPCSGNGGDEEMRGSVGMDGMQVAGGFSMGRTDAMEGGDKKRRRKKKKKKKLRLRNNPKDCTDYAQCRGDKVDPVEITLDFYLEPRINASMDAPRRNDTIYMFGIDLMGTRDIFAYLDGFHPKNIEWINDSSCNVQLESEDDLKGALKELGRPIRPRDIPGGAAKDEGFCMTYLWYRARPFLKGRLHEKVHLMLRMATVDDVKVDTGPKISRQLWLKETNEASHVLRKETKIDHENAEQENQPKARKKRVKRTLLNNQKVKKRKLAQKPKTADNAEEQEMEVVAENATETSGPEGANATGKSPVPLTSCAMLPPDLRDFIGRLRAEHGLS